MASFGRALDAIKDGQKVARTGWNGKGMYLLLVGPYRIGEAAEQQPAVSYVMTKRKDVPHKTDPKPLPWIGMKTADNCFVPWLASQTDMLAEDWELVD